MMPKVVNLFVFNSNLVCREGEEHRKILYYYPSTHSNNTQICNVGLVEALLQFSRSFSVDDDDIHSSLTQKYYHVYLQPEPHFYFVLTVCRFESGTGGGADVNDSSWLLASWLRRLYRLLRLLHGPLQLMCSHSPHLNCRLSDEATAFLNMYVVQRSEEDTTDTLMFDGGGVLYLPVRAAVFLQVVAACNAVTCCHPIISHCLLYYNCQLVWSDLSTDNLSTVHQYLCMTLFPELNLTDHLNRSSSQHDQLGTFMSSTPTELKLRSSGDTVVVAPVVYLREHKYSLSSQGGVVCDADDFVRAKLLIYCYRRFALVMVIDIDAETSVSVCRCVAETVSQQLDALACSISQSLRPSVPSTSAPLLPPDYQQSQQPSTKFVYYNQCNLALTWTMQRDSKTDSSQAGVAADGHNTWHVLNSLVLLQQDLLRLSPRGGCMAAKLALCDGWLAGRVLRPCHRTGRHVFIHVPQNNASLVDVWDHFDHMSDVQFGSVYLPV